MRILIFLILFISPSCYFGQTKGMKISNLLVVGMLEKQEDRFTVEINLTELFGDAGIKSMASLNLLKQGANSRILATDSIQNFVKSKGIDTYVLVSIRGYDRKFKAASNFSDLETELSNGHLFPLYRDDITSVTMEFYFYRNGEFLGYDLIKLNNAGSRDKVLKRLRKKLPKRISRWKL